jgi:hypothetical protein
MMCHELLVSEHQPFQHARYGRGGQEQHGVDIVLRTSSDALPIGVQCKLKTELLHGQLSESEALKEYDKSCLYPGRLQRLWIITTSPRDARVQDLCETISTSWQRRHPVEALFWEDVEDLLDRHPQIAAQYYPEAFAPQSSILYQEGGGLRITLEKANWEERLRFYFNHEALVAAAKDQRQNLMLIASELVDNAFHNGKGKAATVRLALHGQTLLLTDDGASFNAMAVSPPSNPKQRGIRAVREAIEAAGDQLLHEYVPADGLTSRFNTHRFTIRAQWTVSTSMCSASGDGKYLISRRAVADFVRELDIPDSCEKFTLRLYSGVEFFNASGAFGLLAEMTLRLGDRPLVVQVDPARDSLVGLLMHIKEHFPTVTIEYP